MSQPTGTVAPASSFLSTATAAPTSSSLSSSAASGTDTQRNKEAKQCAWDYQSLFKSLRDKTCRETLTVDAFLDVTQAAVVQLSGMADDAVAQKSSLALTVQALSVLVGYAGVDTSRAQVQVTAGFDALRKGSNDLLRLIHRVRQTDAYTKHVRSLRLTDYRGMASAALRVYMKSSSSSSSSSALSSNDLETLLRAVKAVVEIVLKD
jgi:hypothetical protein